MSVFVAQVFEDKTVGLVSVTQVEVSDNLRHATVFYSTLGNEAQRAEVEESLTTLRGRARTHLAHALATKAVPEITFRFDNSIERGVRLERLFDDLAKERERASGGESQKPPEASS